MNKSELIDNIMFAIESNHPELKYEISQIIDRILQDTFPSEQVVEIKSYYVVDTMGEDIEQISVGFDTYKEALNFLKEGYIQKTYPTAYIIGRIN